MKKITTYKELLESAYLDNDNVKVGTVDIHLIEKELFNKVKDYLLSISKMKFGVNWDGGVLMMAKVIHIQGLWDEALEFYHKCHTQGFDITPEQQLDWIKKLQELVYFINRESSCYDDYKTMDITVVDLDKNKVPVDIDDIAEITAYDFSYLLEK